MKNKVLLFLIAVFIFGVSVPVLAIKPDVTAIDLPEVSGTYDVPGRPGMKLKVFVHYGKTDNETKKYGRPAPQPTLSCQSSTSTDLDSNSIVKPAGWKMPSAWVYRLNIGSVPSTVGGANLQTITNSSFSVWTNAMNSAVAISRGADTNANRAVFDGQNIIAWGRTSGSALAVSYVWYNPTTGALAEVDTIMNNKFTWYWSNPAGWISGETCAYQGVYDAQNILTHELGHTVGLDDEYATEFQNNTMFGYGQTGETKKDTLTSGDINGAYSLYW